MTIACHLTHLEKTGSIEIIIPRRVCFHHSFAKDNQIRLIGVHVCQSRDPSSYRERITVSGVKRIFYLGALGILRHILSREHSFLLNRKCSTN